MKNKCCLCFAIILIILPDRQIALLKIQQRRVSCFVEMASCTPCWTRARILVCSVPALITRIHFRFSSSPLSLSLALTPLALNALAYWAGSPLSRAEKFV
jgi:hypothetical protein